MKSPAVGRFAPSPTGPLHMGSLVAAAGSYLNARANGGKWLVRIEDLDPPREMPGAGDDILRTLEAHGLQWDGEIVWQSQRQQAYEAACELLINQKRAYFCQCSRKLIRESSLEGAMGPVYPGTCRDALLRKGILRLRTNDIPVCFNDERCGRQQQCLQTELGDFPIRRADGLFAYQLAVVVDDQWQGITEIVRGEDLLDNTPRQIFLQQQLGCTTPQYLHLPLVTHENGQKLSKQNHAPALDKNRTSENLIAALATLGLAVSPDYTDSSPETLLEYAIREWSTAKTTLITPSLESQTHAK